VLKWIVERLEGAAAAVDTPIGRVPADGALDLDGLTLAPEAVDLLRGVDVGTWRDEAALIPAFYERFGDHLPAALWDEYRALLARLDEEEAAPPKLALSA